MKRNWIRSLLAVALTAGIGAAALWFQPWKLWVDDRVDEVAPKGARVITLASTSAPVATTSIPSSASSTTPDSVPPSEAPAPTTTEFVSLDHGTSGRLLLLEDERGVRFIRFEDFATDNGPDLFVYLSTNPVDGDEGAFDDDFVNLGRLDGNIGNQNYEIPDDVDLSRFASVVIWCDRFNSAFGAAPLS
jgi:hypothetical protein